MSFLSKILKSKDSAKKPQRKEKQAEEPKPETKAESNTKVLKGKIIAGILRAPHITEKTTMSAERGTYVFSVAPGANKIEVAKAVRARYNVTVKNVRMINMPGKERHRGRQIGWKPGLRKAMVTLTKGQSIDIQ